MVITDAQVHVWRADDPSRPWPPGGASYAHGPSFSPQELLAEMAAAGVDRAVLIPPSFEGDRNDYCLAAAQAYPDRFAVMGRIALGDPRSRTAMRDWLAQPGMLGLRVTFGSGFAAPVDDPEVAWLWEDAQTYHIPVMVSAAAYLDRLIGIVARHPGLRLVIDRLGAPVGADRAALDAALDQLSRLARYDTVAVKASGLPEMADETSPPFVSVYPVLHRVLDDFGPRRVFWASDLTRMPCTYRQVLDLFTDALSGYPSEYLEWVLGKGVSTWLGWPSPSEPE